jgi:hypothetical protein
MKNGDFGKIDKAYRIQATSIYVTVTEVAA